MITGTGTLHYKAPEIYEGSYDESVDNWAVGVITYELLQGKLPFNAEFVGETTELIKKAKYTYAEGEEPPK